MFIQKLKELSIDDDRIKKLNELLQDWFDTQKKTILLNNDFILLNNSIFLLFYYWILLKWLSSDKYAGEILSYLNQWYKNLETSLFIWKTFLTLLNKLELEDTWLWDNQYVWDLLKKHNDGIIYDEQLMDNEINTAMYLFLNICNQWFSSIQNEWLNMLTLSENETNTLISKGKWDITDVISKINSIRYIFTQLESSWLLNNLFMFNYEYIQNKIKKADDITTKEIIIKINSWLNDLFKIDESIFLELNKKWLNISNKNYKTLFSKNFLINYALKIIPSNVENPPFFKTYVSNMISNIDKLLENYYSKSLEQIEKKEIDENHFVYNIRWVRLNHKKNYSDLDPSFGLLQYLNLQYYIYNYIITNNIDSEDLDNIILKIDCVKKNVWTFNNRIKVYVTYQLFFNEKLIYEINND